MDLHIILSYYCLSGCGQANRNKQVKQGTDSLQNDTASHPVDSVAYAYLWQECKECLGVVTNWGRVRSMTKLLK